MANTTTGLKNVNILTKDRYLQIEQPATDELYAISGSGFGFPSSNYEDLELGASGTEYTAPANGYFYINKTTASTNQYITMDNTKGYGIQNQPNISPTSIKMMLPVQKGNVVIVSYNASGTTNVFRFIYAEGE